MSNGNKCRNENLFTFNVLAYQSQLLAVVSGVLPGNDALMILLSIDFELQLEIFMVCGQICGKNGFNRQ